MLQRQLGLAFGPRLLLERGRHARRVDTLAAQEAQQRAAGAGVVGVAIGFGAQTLVKDIISGFFFLLDDAFRVGEYIESGSYKGTVESFSLRSVKLRHQRGPLYTVPFGSLGAIVNHSRDWVIDRLYVNVTYDTDLDLVKQLIKAIGRELAANPAYAPDILETLKLHVFVGFYKHHMRFSLPPLRPR